MSTNIEQIKSLLLSLLPKDGSTVGNMSLKDQIRNDHQLAISDEDFDAARNQLLDEGTIGKGRGRGGATYLHQPAAGEQAMPDGFELQAQQAPSQEDLVYSSQKPASPKAPRQPAKKKGEHSQVLSYRYDEKRKNNPHVGMVDTHSDGEEQKATWQYDPHLSPELQFDSTRSQVEDLIEDVLHAREVEAKQAKDDLLMWLDHALAADNESAIREVVTNLRKRVAGKEFLERERGDLSELKRMQAPYLNWTGKAERTSFEVDTVSLHVHERIDPATILAAVQKRIKDSKGKSSPALQPDLFHAPFENLPLRDAIDFYKHERDWANRMIAGDSLLVMNSLLEKEGMGGNVQMVFIDPPYGIKYGSNFQPFVNKKDVKDRRDEDLTQEPEMIKAFRDTWELGLHSYLSYLRDRLLLARELLAESGSIFVQISDENIHHVRELMDEIFGVNNFISEIYFRKKTMPLGAKFLESMGDYLVWYGKDKDKTKYRQLFQEQSLDGDAHWVDIQLPDGSRRKKTTAERRGTDPLPSGSKVYSEVSLYPPSFSPKDVFPFDFQGRVYRPKPGASWISNERAMNRLKKANRIGVQGEKNLRYCYFLEDYPLKKLSSAWLDTVGDREGQYVVRTSPTVIERCILMTTDPGDLVLDPTCGSGTSAFASEKWGRRWITCDTSRVAITLAKQRMITSSFPYFELKFPQEGLSGGFIYKTQPKIGLKSFANNAEIDEIYDRHQKKMQASLADLNKALIDAGAEFMVQVGARAGKTVRFSPDNKKSEALETGENVSANQLLSWEVPYQLPEIWPESVKGQFEKYQELRAILREEIDASIASHAGQETLYDDPRVSKNKLRITGPFTVEAVPFATVLGLGDIEKPERADVAIARSGANSRHSLWRDELLRTGIRGKSGQKLKLQDLEVLPQSKYIHAIGTLADTGERVAVSFGPEYAALEQRQVEIAMRDAGDLFPLPKMLVFCAFNFDPEAAKDIDNIRGIHALKVQMNTDLLTTDLKKGRASNESFWLMGQPDVQLHELKGGKLQVEVHGFDYFDTKTGELKSGGKKNIAMWQLDTDYDNRSLYARQVFFPMAGKKDGWYKLKKDIRAELNEDLLDQFHGTKSIPFEPGDNRCIAVKIVDDRGIESLKVIRLD
ncbi:site-specific DNA-methyltransferase [Marinobacter sp. DS40M6]|uniref:site-specific DNA-methyltransferase n=1 Tax=Marinobacter sp. DS40M6 TaxID=1597776 RepID=UPI0023595484|nr:site-specific DNA-methyltransferase [Marinobacter sp. DS40M6]MDC8454696.1 site-specific DNA-methyltransferase [Marinobacter sp. DS40M6]